MCKPSIPSLQIITYRKQEVEPATVEESEVAEIVDATEQPI